MGEEAFEKAQREDKPLFISIGYYSCHWCHVMEKESFEDPEIAEILNTYFVPIKVDREERPDVDSFYMEACLALNGSGGWPLTVLATPDKKPFFVGTYFPKEGKWGRPGLKDILLQVAKLWKEDRKRLLSSADRLLNALKGERFSPSTASLGEDILHSAFERLMALFDGKFGGFGDTPKFPTPHKLMFLNRYFYRYGKNRALLMVEKTLTQMALGGIRDHLRGGFHRYSTDRYWLLPHFEKMLYDQAMLIFAYTEGYKLLKKDLYRKVTEEIIRYLEREMFSPEGGFYASQDADSEGEEGKFYTWSLEELKKVLTPEEFEIVVKVYNLRQEGNYREEATGRLTGRNILHMTKIPSQLSEELNLTEETLKKLLERIREKLFKEQEKRVKPSVDKKILVDWNGLTVAALSYAGRSFENHRWIELAKKTADFILEKLLSPSGKLWHRYAEGEVKYEALLDDYAFFIWGLLELYEATLQGKYLKKALELTQTTLNHFWDEEGGGFYLTPDYLKDIPLRKKEFYDGATPSGNSAMAYNLIRLGRLLGLKELERFGEKTLTAMASYIYRTPIGYTFALIALDLLVNGSKELYIVGTKEDYTPLLKEINREFLPDLDFLKVDETTKAVSDHINNLSRLNGKTTYYLCRNYTCEKPTDNPEDILKILRGY